MKIFAASGSAALPGRPAQGYQGLAALAGEAWNTVTGPVRRYLRREAVYRELAELDDRMLADIGLNRGDVFAVARGLRRDA